MNINHPLPLNTFVTANFKDCPCRGGNLIQISGTIQKVITNQSGIWYYLSSGKTINSNNIISIQ